MAAECPFNESYVCSEDCHLFEPEHGMCAIKVGARAVTLLLIEFRNLTNSMRTTTQRKSTEDEPLMVDAVDYPVDLP